MQKTSNLLPEPFSGWESESMLASSATPAVSWEAGASPVSLGEIVSAEKSVAVWQRQVDKTIATYFENTFESLGLGIRSVFSMASLKSNLNELLPEADGKTAAINDIYLLADMLTCLFDCDGVGLRLAPLCEAMCPKLHVDKIAVRMVSTYLGEGTEWLPNEKIVPAAQAGTGKVVKTAVHQGYYNSKDIKQLNAFDVALLKGSAWGDNESMSAIHRSCQVPSNSKRVLLTLDPVQS